MTDRTSTLRILILLFLASFGATAAFGQAQHRGVSRVTLASGIGQSVARKCGACHSPEFSLWARNVHSHFLIDPSQDPRLVYGRWGHRSPGWVEHVSDRFKRDDVALAFGVLQIQVYFSKDPDGHRLLPAQWNIRERRWEPLQPELQLVRRKRATWEDQCAGCHTTGFHPADGTFEEANASCGACHGDGAAHMESGGQKPVLDPSDLEPKRRADICGACHSRGKSKVSDHPYPVGYRPGAALEEFFQLKVPTLGTTGECFWPDGTERLPFMEYLGFMQSGHSGVGLSCTTCHLPHGSDNPHGLRRKTAELCRGCHGEDPEPGPVHRGHPEVEAHCVGCHMSFVNPEPNQAHVRTHTLRFLDPARALETGMPSSCTVECHSDRSLRWAVDALEVWRGH